MSEFSANWFVHALGWTLLHFVWQGAVVAALLWSGLQLLARRSAQARYAAACCALALIVVLPLATFGRIALVEHSHPMKATSIALAPPLVVRAGMGEGTWLTQFATALDPVVPWVPVAWLAGSMLFLLRLSAGFSVTRRMRLLTVSAPADELLHVFAALKQRLRMTRPVKLMNSALVQVPTVIGWLRPMVLVPVSCFTGLPQAQIEAILCHELAHIRRHDYLVSIVQSVVEALLFYHPAVWWVSRQMRRERECCCDDLAVTVGGDALAYARALTTLEAQRSLYPQMMLGANGGILTMRIKRLLIAERSSVASQVAAVAVLAVLTVSAIAIAGSSRAEAKSTAAVEPVLEVSTPPVAIPNVAPTVVVHVRNNIHPMVAPKPQAPSPAPKTPIQVEGGVAAGNIVSKAQPIYPAEARAAFIQGAVVLRAVISAEGNVENLQVVSGPKELYNSAIDAVRRWKYKPYLLNGQPTEVETTITVNYHMSSAQPAPTGQNSSQSSPDNPVRFIGGNVAPPLVIYSPEPEVSEEAREKKINGSVLLHLLVEQDGSPSNVQVLRGLGYGLDEKAVATVKLYKFKPAMEDGKPVTVAINVEVHYNVF